MVQFLEGGSSVSFLEVYNVLSIFTIGFRSEFCTRSEITGGALSKFCSIICTGSEIAGGGARSSISQFFLNNY